MVTSKVRDDFNKAKEYERRADEERNKKDKIDWHMEAAGQYLVVSATNMMDLEMPAYQGDAEALSIMKGCITGQLRNYTSALRYCLKGLEEGFVEGLFSSTTKGEYQKIMSKCMKSIYMCATAPVNTHFAADDIRRIMAGSKIDLARAIDQLRKSGQNTEAHTYETFIQNY